MTSELLVVLLLMLLNGVFAGAEIAVLSVRKTRIAELMQDRHRGAEAVYWLRHRPERFLATVQIAITLVGTAAAAFGGERIAHGLSTRLAGVPGVGAWAAPAALVLVIVGISCLEIVVGELVPKSIALRYAERYSLAMGPFLRAMATAVRPAVWLLTKISNSVLRLFGDSTSFSEARLSPEEIQELVEEAAREGSLDAKSGEIASRALDFRELRASDVMVPRHHFVMVAAGADLDAVRAVIRPRRYARLPVYDTQPDNIIGYVSLKDVLSQVLEPEDFSIREHLRPARFVPVSARAADLLKVLQTERAAMIFVVDEGGSVRGLVTVEDLLEELVGDILSEQDPAPVVLAPEADGSVLVPASLPLREVMRSLDIELPEGEGYTTLAGLCIHLAERIPATGERFELPGGWSLVVEDANARRVRAARLIPPPPEAAASDAGE